MEETGKDPAVLVEERGLKQVTDTGAIEAAVKAVIAANPDKVAAYKAKPTMFGWFVGQVMKATGGKANPKAVNEILKKLLDAWHACERASSRARARLTARTLRSRMRARIDRDSA